MNGLKIIKIIISSSIEDITKDILEVKAFFNTLNDIYIDRNIFFSIETAAPDADDSLLESIGNSELAFLLFYKKVGETFRHTFEKAVEIYKGKEKPLIIPYFKFTDNAEDVSEDIKNLQDHLGNDLRHYYKSYNDPNTLKLYMIMQIKQMQLDSLPFEINGNVIKFAGKELVPIDSIPAFANNKHLKELQKKLDELNKISDTVEEKYFSDRSNKELREEYFSTISEISEITKKIEEHKNTLFESVKTIIKETTKGGLSVRQIEGYRLMEMGDYEAALEILDHDKIMSDLDRNTSMADAFIENIQINANELSQRIEALKGKGLNSETSKEILAIYDELRGLIKKYGDLDKTPLFDHADFLHHQNDHEKAIEIAEEYLSFINKSEDYEKLSCIYNFLGLLYNETQRFKEAENVYIKALDIFKKLAEKNPNDFKHGLAVVYNNLGNLYKDTCNFKESEEAYIQALEISKEAAAKRSDFYKLYIAYSYNNLGTLYMKMQRYKEAEEFFYNALEIKENLAAKYPDNFENELPHAYNNLASFYNCTGQYDKAKTFCLKAMDSGEKLLQKDPYAMAPDLAWAYNTLGHIYFDMQEYAEAEKYLLRSMEIEEMLYIKSPNSFASDLTDTYNMLGALYYKAQIYDRAEEIFLKALNAQKRSAIENPEFFAPYLAVLYNNLGLLYRDMQKSEKSKEFLTNALEIYSKFNYSGSFDDRIEKIKYSISQLQ